MRVLARQGVLDQDLHRPLADLAAAHPQIAAAVDHKAHVVAKPLGEQVRRETLADPAAVEAHAWRAANEA